jgi:hypothetical protein
MSLILFDSLIILFIFKIYFKNEMYIRELNDINAFLITYYYN